MGETCRLHIKAGFFRSYEYIYDAYYDCVLCPNNQVLSYSTTSRDGYREFKTTLRSAQIVRIFSNVPTAETIRKLCRSSSGNHTWSVRRTSGTARRARLHLAKPND